uniref:Uncharacterized protein n=1 Tax=viral metagenome TaxID=1070528 RepID=A0A6C0LEY4_9ZZZZ
MFKNKILTLSLIALFVTLVLVLIMFPLLKWWTSENFFNGSGYGLNSRFSKINTLVPLNNTSKSTDFKLFSLMSQIRFSFVKPPSNYDITGTREGIISKTGNRFKNIILFPGQSDYILRQNNTEVWPRNIQNINNSKSAVVYENNNGHFNTITTLLENLNYINGDRLNTITYDFRNINFDNVYNKFVQFLKDDTVIIAYDFGAVVANMCINKFPNNEQGDKMRSKISKLLLICPTIGGVPMTLRDYFSGNGIIDPNIIQDYHSVLLSMPNKKLYDLPVAIFNSLSYNADNINVLMEQENKPSELFLNLRKQFQESSMQNPNVQTIIIACDQFSTPVSYNFRNNLREKPETYKPQNNNQFPLTDIHNNGNFEGLQAHGDRVVPINSINKLKELWGDNCKIELIKDKDHFTILKSYELALIILSNL